MSPVKGSRTTIPPFTLGYCFKFHEFFTRLTKIISPKLKILEINFFFGIVHLRSAELITPFFLLFSSII